MPEATDEVEIELKLSEELLRRMLELKENEIIMACDGKRYFNITRKNGDIYISLTEEVTIEFDMSNYAPDHDWRD